MIYLQPILYATSIYKHSVNKNTGGDPIAELYSEYIGEETKSSRVLISPLKNSKYTDNVNEVYLTTYIARADLLLSGNIELLVYKLSLLWDPGYGLSNWESNIRQYGATWIKRNISDTWSIPGAINTNSTTQSSYIVNSRNIYTPLEFKILNVFDNLYGYLLKLSDEGSDIGTLYLYSANTNTPYSPKYKLCIDDYIYITSSSTNSIVDVLQSDQYLYTIKNISQQYRKTDIVRNEIQITPKYYNRDWTTEKLYQYTGSYVLSDDITASYALYDVSQIERLPIILHSIYTRINCDGNRNYFMFDMLCLTLGRYYQFLLKIDNRYYLINEVFKIV